MSAPVPIIVPMSHVSSSDSSAKRIACESLFKVYDAKTASVTQMQDYAECVRFMNPKSTDLMPLKGFVLFLLLTMVVGGFVGARDNGDWDDILMGAMAGLLVAFGISLVIAAVAFLAI